MIHFLSPLFPLEIQFAWRLLAAVILGALMGFERSLSGKHAGMRTYALVAMGSAAFVAISTLASFQLSLFTGINPLQIASSVVIGIGFIGSGLAAFHNGQPELTTASGLWVAAAVGMACGFGFYLIAASATILALVVLSALARVEKIMRIRWGVEQKG